MADQAEQKNAYGQAITKSSGRQAWDREAYAIRGAERELKEKAESRARWEAKQSGQRYIRQATPPDASLTSSRNARLDVANRVGTTTLVTAGNAVGKKGRGAGFYCEDCDLTFKDNLQWVDHLNGRQHLVNTGQTGFVQKASLQDVRDRLALLKRKREERLSGEEVDLDVRLKIRREQEDKIREERREKRRIGRRGKTSGNGAGVRGDESKPGADEPEDEMAKMMGFGGFSTTKV